ncbi:protein-glucosylgalactosylhydroxylysine glucosidase [Microcaecilia unicolor]|uniref:Protein-glucosylgalactosylhydroxylysine glucosidase n=1 Tax=Microcaecilia unicolor TaxID=1415580 RepID=A0A6P7XQJ9_9AMPH|nr:protein-glucosylgalactosylhydroxylysine glucosidase [Microcaecilia unicolor]
MSDFGQDPSVFTASTLPADPRLMATVANGYLGTRIYGDVLHVNGVYNGAVGDCHRADVPSPLCVKLRVPCEEEMTETFTLNTRTGTFTCELQSSHYRITQRIFIHRAHFHLMAFTVSIERLATTAQPITVLLETGFTPQSQDLHLEKGPDFQGAQYIYGRTLTPEVKGGPQPVVHMIWVPPPPSLTLTYEEQARTWEFLTAVAESEEDVKKCFTEGLNLISSGQLILSHEQAWAKLWERCNIDLHGPMSLRKALHGCLYYILGSLPPLRSSHIFHGISPGGLSNGRKAEDYWGHVFWDQDTWIYPNVLLLYPELARAVLGYRVQMLNGALRNAEEQGYQGAKFPWESAATGCEVCPDKIYGEEEIHINGDVLLAFQQYYYTTQDLEFFSKGGGWEVVSSIAKYWCSRVLWSEEEQCFHLRGVMPPDEYHSNVTNSVYTNVIAQNSLNFAVELATQLQIHAPKIWQKIAKKIKVPFDPERKYHPEFDGYRLGDCVKQADVILLGFPLQYPMNPEIQRNDLEIYEAITDPGGPAMTWSMFAVGWMQLKEIQKAQNLLKKCYGNITEPFQIWTENTDGSGAVNFLTGMGGFLQAVLFGYTGFRITKNSLNFDPICPDDITCLTITGVCYLGNRFSFTLEKEEVTIMVISQCETQTHSLEVVLTESGQHFLLSKGHPVSFPTGPGEIRKITTCSLF